MQNHHVTITHLYIYPIKSLGPIAVDFAKAHPYGFEYDRQWMLVDNNDVFITQRKLPILTKLRQELTSDSLIVRASAEDHLVIPLKSSGDQKMARVWQDSVAGTFAADHINKWFSRVVGTECRLFQQDLSQIRKIPEEFGVYNQGVSLADGFPYLITTKESLESLNSKLEVPVSQLNFRPNIVVEGRPAFDEDRWSQLEINNMSLQVTKGCSRCTVINVDRKIGKANRGGEPLKTLSNFRKFEGGIMFGQNAATNDTGDIKVGDTLGVLMHP